MRIRRLSLFVSATECEARAIEMSMHPRRTASLQQLIKMAGMLLLLLVIKSEVQAQGTLDSFDPNANGTVWVVVVQPDGKILLGGDFTTLSPNGGVAVTRNRIARLNPDGTLDTTFNPNGNGGVYAITLQADGKILVGGFFTSIGGQARNRIARLDTTTGLADSFNPSANNSVYSMAVQADGKILVGGHFNTANGLNSIGGQPRNFIGRLDATTGLADSFDPDANYDVVAIAVQADGKILVGGTFNVIGGQTRPSIARLDAATGLADSFNPNAIDLQGVFSIAVQAEGKILVGGFFTSIGGQTRNRIARLDTTTGLADSFDPNANGGVVAMAVQADGKIIVGGEFTNIGGQSRYRIARLDAMTGSPDSFDPSANDRVNSVAVQADGKILAGGFFTTVAPNGGAMVTRNRIARLQTDTPIGISLSMHSVSSNAINNGNSGVGIDDVIELTPSDITLTGQPVVTSGLVADGVTPLLIEIDLSPAPANAATFQITMTDSGGSITNGLASHLRVLQYSGSSGTFVAGSTVILSPSHPSGFAYISGINSDDLQISPPNYELSVTMTVQQVGNPTNSRELLFKIRRPPIALVHGFHSDNGAWFNDAPILQQPNAFVNVLLETIPRDFIVPVEYGVDRSIADPTYVNTYQPFEFLAPILDLRLRTQIEGAGAPLRQQWALTRYNAVGHSQGGLLLRMLCTQDNPSWQGGDFHSFRSATNAYRGRFHRVVTIGSPHNGSTLVHYLNALRRSNPIAIVPAVLEHQGYLQDKFDPFGPQMRQVNVDHWNVDPGAKFNLLGTTIYAGMEPPVIPSLAPPPLAYVLENLCALAPGQLYSRGHVVLPGGSDGVVDRLSQFAGASEHTPLSLIGGINISHSSGNLGYPLFGNIFGVSDADTFCHTRNNVVALKVRDLLSGPSSAFGSFVREPLPAGLEAQIDAVATFLPPLDDLITPNPSRKEMNSSAWNSPGATNTYNFTLTPASGQEPATTPVWFAQVFGPQGVTGEGITVTPNASNPNSVTVSVGDSVVGDVVLYVSYATGEGKLIVGTPLIVVSRPPGPTLVGIQIMPATIALSVGANLQIGVWGDFGVASQLYIAPGAAITYTSSAPSIADVDTLGRISLKAPGVATITVSYLNFSAFTTVTVAPLPAPPALVAPPADVPSITVQPSGASLYVGANVSFSVIATGAAPLSYQWQFDGTNIAGATSPTLSLSNLTQAQGGYYSAVVTNSSGTVISSPALLAVLQPVQLGNISTRLRVQTSDNVLIGGFIVTGTQPKRIIARGIGPSLTALGVPGALANPYLELYDSSGQMIAINDDWVGSANKHGITASGLAPTDERESAILTTVSPGGYTAIVRGVNNTTGVGLVELYDLDRAVDSKLANVSTRGFVDTGDNVMIGGTIVIGGTPANVLVLVRAIGPSLTNFGVPNALQDPTLEVYDGNGALLASNDNWRSDQEAEIMATGIPPTNNLESAIIRTLPTGAYTAIIRGQNNSTGVALVEAYHLQ